MKSHSLASLLVIAILAAAPVCAWPENAPSALPPELQQSLAIARKFELARVKAQLASWETTETLPTSAEADKTKWRLTGGALSLTRQGLLLAGNADERSTLTYAGKKFTLPLGVTYEVMIPDGPAWDGGMMLVPPNQANADSLNGFAFVVGGFRGTENYLEFLGQNHHDLGGPLLKTGAWTKVTLLLSSNSVIAMLDDQPLTNEPLPRRVAQQMELSLYTFSKGALFRNITILKPKANAATMPAPDAGEEEKTAVQAAAKYLGDSSFDRRQAASDALYMLRPASLDTVKQLKSSNDMEVVNRAIQIANRIAAEGKAPSVRTPIRSGIIIDGPAQVQPLAR